MSFVTTDSERLPRYRGAWFALGWVMTGTVAFGSLWPSVPQVTSGMSDKFLHFAAYAGLAFTFAGVVERGHWGRVLVGLLLFGGGIELAQAYLSSTRGGEWLDLAANAGGIVAGLLTAALFPRSWCRELEIVAGLDGVSR